MNNFYCFDFKIHVCLLLKGDIRDGNNGNIVEMFPTLLQSVSSTLYKRGKFGGQEDNEQKLFCHCVKEVIAAEYIQQEFTDKLWTYLLGLFFIFFLLKTFFFICFYFHLNFDLECKSYNDLIGCFAQLFKAVRNETFKPLVGIIMFYLVFTLNQLLNNCYYGIIQFRLNPQMVQD